MLTPEQTGRLARLHNRCTAYKLVASLEGRHILIAYSQGRSRHSIMKCLQNRGEKVVAALGLGAHDLIIWAKRAGDGCTVGPWAVRFSGRTEREAIMSGELPYVGDVAQERAA